MERGGKSTTVHTFSFIIIILLFSILDRNTMLNIQEMNSNLCCLLSFIIHGYEIIEIVQGAYGDVHGGGGVCGSLCSPGVPWQSTPC